MGTDDETCINNREVPEACILENYRSYDSKVDVGGGELSDGRLVGEHCYRRCSGTPLTPN